MEKQITTFSANEQKLQKTSGIDCYASNIVAYIEARFDLGDNWSGYDSVRAVWWNDYNKTVATVLDSDGSCIVPYEVLTRKSAVKVNLVGSIADGDVLTDRLTTCPVVALTIKCNAKTDGDNTQPITPSQYEQFVANVKADADRAEAGATASEQSAQSASESATTSANSATSSAQSAIASAQSAQNASESAITAENAKDDAEDARDKILSMRATAETLEAGSDATASYSDGLLTLGIPRGDKGVKGDTGETGATPNISIGTVETLAPTEDATATITGTAENPVLNLGLPKGDTGEVTMSQLSALLPTDTASGSIVSITDGQSVVPAKSLKVQLEPIQSGSGTPSPDNVRPISGRTEVVTSISPYEQTEKHTITGKNLYNAPNNQNRVLVPCHIENGQTVVASCGGSGAGIRYYNANKTQIDYWTLTLQADGRYYRSFTASGGIEYVEFYGATSTNYMVEVGASTPSDYEPYGYSYTTALGRTVYGGTLDVVSGELVVDRAMVDLGTLNWIAYDGNRFAAPAAGNVPVQQMKQYANTEVANIVCSQYETYERNTLANGQISLHYSGQNYVNIIDTNYSDAQSFKTAMSGVQLCYELAEPQTIQLSPQQVQLIAGQNNVWSDGDVTLVYSADIQRYIEKKLNGNSTTSMLSMSRPMVQTETETETETTETEETE